MIRKQAERALRDLCEAAKKPAARYKLHSGRIGGATFPAGRGASESIIRREGRGKSDAHRAYVRATLEDARWHEKLMTSDSGRVAETVQLGPVLLTGAVRHEGGM